MSVSEAVDAGPIAVVSERLIAAVEAIRLVQHDALSSDELITLLRVVEQQLRRLASADLKTVAALEARGVARELGYRDVRALLIDVLNLGPDQARQRVRDAELLTTSVGATGSALPARFPRVADAFAGGLITVAHARLITAAIDRLPIRVQDQVGEAAESFLVEQALVVTPKQLSVIVRRLGDTLDPDGLLSEPADHQRRREFVLRERADGSGQVAGELTPEVFQQLRAALDPLARPARCSDAVADAQASSSTSEDGVVDSDRRTGAQRYHDALGMAMSRLLRSGELPDSGGIPTTVLVTMSVEQFETHRGIARADTGALLGVAELLSGPADVAVVPVALDRGGGVAAIGHKRRLATPSQRYALAVRDKGCSFPGCVIPARWSQTHHVTGWSLTRSTDLEDLTLACGFHHHALDRGWECAMKGGRAYWTPPSWIDPERRPRRNTAHDLPRLVHPPPAPVHDQRQRPAAGVVRAAGSGRRGRGGGVGAAQWRRRSEENGRVSDPSLFDTAMPGPAAGPADPSMAPPPIDPNAPLAARMRPRTLDEVVGQDHLLAPGSPLRRLVEGDAPMSLILYGPPGTGKTSIASIVSAAGNRRLVAMSALNSGVKDVRAVIEQAKRDLGYSGRQTVLFIDEIHRFSKTQQDSLLAAVEARTVTLVAATTENPFFSVVSPLLSRSLLLTLEPLTDDDIGRLVDRAVEAERGLGGAVTLADDARAQLVRLAQGDARRALTALEAAAGSAQAAAGSAQATGGCAQATDDATPTALIDLATVELAVQTTALRYDRDGDQHYDVISAFIKSIRGSDPDAALHYLARMIVAGEDPRFIARRLVVHASEDIGLADPTALLAATAAAEAVQLIGLPEARINLAQATIHLATAPKSNAVVSAIDAAIADVRDGRAGPVPPHLRDGHYPGATKLGNAAQYRYPHADPAAVVTQQYPPDELVGRNYYEPSGRGGERVLAERLAALREIVRGDGAPR